jgi:hypothetical protein
MYKTQKEVPFFFTFCFTTMFQAAFHAWLDTAVTAADFDLLDPTTLPEKVRAVLALQAGVRCFYHYAFCISLYIFIIIIHFLSLFILFIIIHFLSLYILFITGVGGGAAGQ